MSNPGGGIGAARASTETAARRGHLAHQPALDGLRGVAVAGVLLFHGGHLRGGFLGVDAFFVLSGFLITSLLLAEVAAHGGIALGAFWARRARRLLPALAGVLAAVALYALLVAKPDELATIRGDALATVGYFANWRAIATSRDYWAMFRSPSPLQHTWSLAIEEQFYLVWPLLVALVVRGCRAQVAARRVFVTAVVLALASLAWTLVIFDPADPSRVYYGTDTRVASILVGAALAAWLNLRGPARTRRSRGVLEVSGVVALAALAVVWARVSGSSIDLYRGGLFLSAIATAVVIAAAVHPRRGVVSRVLSFRPACALGLISYGVYLWHWPIFVFLDSTHAHVRGWPLFALRIVATLAISIVSYRVIELPIRHGSGAWTRSRSRSFTLSFTTAVAVVAAIVLATASAPRPRVVVADPIRSAGPTQVAFTRHGHPGTRVESVTTSQRVLVVGNSIALYGADEGFKQLHTTPALDVLNLGSVGCRLLPESTSERYPSGEVFGAQSTVCRNNWALAVKLFRPDVVVMLVSEPTDSQHLIDGHWTEPCQPAYDDILETELHDQIRLLAAQGARVVVATAAYGALPNKTPAWFQHDDCQNAIFRRVVATEPRAVLADVFAWICPHLDADCDDHLGNVVLRPDGVHFRDASARLLAAWVITRAQRHGAFRGVRIEGPELSAIATPPSR